MHFRSLHSHEKYGAVVNTLHQFLWSIDTNKPQEFAHLFAPNGKCEVVRAGLVVEGSESLRKLCSDIHNRFSPALHIVMKYT